ncbi:MAG: 3-phosphoshikimate 1-carboxyvinyltransferase [Acidimicrobiia bacterium]|nr:3-phosphoshikimate 1-carboxyvinyltransferase [Acidimicrobiia bacterium]
MGSDTVEIEPLPRPPDAVVRVPGSKSYTNRALVAAALATGTSRLDSALFGDDTRHMARCLDAIGIRVRADEANCRFDVEGRGGDVPASRAELFVGNAGTVARFLPPLLALGNGEFVLDGVPRMRERPLGPLLDAITALGGSVESIAGTATLPVRLSARGLEGGRVEMPADTSSQFVSGLLLAGPYMRKGLDLTVTTRAVSRPYLDMTLDTMTRFGIEVRRSPSHFTVPTGVYRATQYTVEPDASAASYFFAAAAVTGGRVRVDGLGSATLQGDAAFVDVLARMGCTVTRTETSTTVQGPAVGGLRGVDVDMSDMSDVAQTLAVIAPFAATPTHITGIGFIRGKETDRIEATVAELRRLGVDARADADGISVNPSRPRSATVETYDDHRMAMSFALVGLLVKGVRIADPACCAKTFPAYFEVLDSLRDTSPHPA